MTHTTFMDKFPVNTLVINKSETSASSIDDILKHYESKIQKHPIATYIAIFDHYAHTTALEGEINPEIKNAKNIIFCFGAAIPNSKILAIRPRSIGVAEKEDSFVIEFMDAPKEKLTEVMTEWTQALLKD